MTYYVSPNGNDLNSGLTGAEAFRTVDHRARMAVHPNDVLLLERGGIWEEQLIVRGSGVAAAPITFAAYGEGQCPILRKPGASKVAFAVSREWLVFRDLEVQSGQEGFGLKGSCSNILFDHCVARACTNDGFKLYGTSSATMLECLALDNVDDGISQHDSTVLTISGGLSAGNGTGLNNIAQAVCCATGLIVRGGNAAVIALQNVGGGRFTATNCDFLHDGRAADGLYIKDDQHAVLSGCIIGGLENAVNLLDSAEVSLTECMLIGPNSIRSAGNARCTIQGCMTGAT